jgi:hypothetical protein
LRFSVGERHQIQIPKEMSADVREFYNEEKILPMDKRVMIVERLQTRTVFWVFNPAEARFEEPIIGAQAAYFPEGYAWMPEGASAALNIWLRNQLRPTQVEGIQIQSKDQIRLSSDHRRLLLSSGGKTGELWETDLSSGKASRLVRISAPDFGEFSFSTDQNLVFLRQLGGLYFVWDHEGKTLGSLGVVGSDVVSSSYQRQCHEILLWTSEGQRLEFRRGFNVPFFGFIPERDCSAQKSLPRRLIDVVFSHLVN